MADAKQSQIERRVVTGDVRAKRTDDGPSMLSGYAAVIGKETIIGEGTWWAFREIIAPQAFTGTLTDPEILGLWNHDTNFVLGRTGAGTVRVSEDAEGLAYEIDVNKADPQAVSVAAKVDRGDVHTSSFAFSVDEDGEDWDTSPTKEGKLPLRTIKRISRLYDVSPVAAAAYPQTSVSARVEARAKELHGTTVTIEIDGHKLAEAIALVPSTAKVEPASFDADPASRERELALTQR